MTSNDNLYRFVKASERPPQGTNQKRLSILYKGSPESLVYLHDGWYWWESTFLQSLKYPVEKDSWSAIEWLEKIEADQGELWKELFMDYYTRGKTIKELSQSYTLIPKQ